MRYVSLFALVDREGTRRFAYGNAVPDDGTLSETGFWSRARESLAGGCTVEKYAAALGDEAFAAMHGALRAGAPIALTLSGSAEAIAIAARSGMVERGLVRASTADSQRYAPLQGEDEDHRVLWSSNPGAFLDDLLSVLTGAATERAGRLREFTAALRQFAGVPFDAGQFWRIGCFEIVEPAVPGATNHDLVFEPLNDPTPDRIRIALRGALADAATHLHVRVEGGTGGATPLPFLDRIIPFGSERELILQLPETGFAFFVSVHGGADHRCLRTARWTRIQGFAMSSRTIGEETAWLTLLPAELRARAEAGLATPHSGVSRLDPWVTAQATAIAYEAQYFPPRAPGFYLFNEPDQQRAFMKMVVASAGAGTVIIADPFFDATALEAHFVGEQNVGAAIEIVTSLRDDTGTPPIVDTEGESGADEAEDSTSEACGEQSPVLSSLLDLARARANDLPRRLRIRNVQTKDAGNGQQFHDRFIAVRVGSNVAALWWLGNSVNSIGKRRYPLFAAEVQGVQRIEFAEYVDRLGAGTIAQRPKAHAVQHYVNAWTYTPTPGVAPDLPDLHPFAGWEDIVTLLGQVAGSDVDTSSPEATSATIRTLAAAGLVTIAPPYMSWRIAQDQEAHVASVVAAILANPGELNETLEMLASWAAAGGLPASNVRVNSTVLTRVLNAAYSTVEARAAANPAVWQFTQRTFEDSIDEARVRLEYMSHGAESRDALLRYVRDLAMVNSPSAYWTFVIRCRRDPVYASVTADDWTPVRDAGDAALTLGDANLTAQVVALRLVDRGPEAAGVALRTAAITEAERRLGLTLVLVDGRASFDELWPAFAPIWDGAQIAPEVAHRLAALLDRHHPGEAVSLLAALADVHTECVTLREDLITRWTRYLKLTDVPGPEPGVLDGYARSEAERTQLAMVVVTQLLARGDAPRRFKKTILSKLDVRDLTMAFGRTRNYDAWQDAGQRAARVVFVACRIMEQTGDDVVLPTATTRLVNDLNVNAWGDDVTLIAVNAVVALARVARGRPLIAQAVTNLLAARNVPALLRLAAGIWLTDDAAQIIAHMDGVDLEAAGRSLYFAQERDAVLKTFTGRLEAVAPHSGLADQLRETWSTLR